MPVDDAGRPAEEGHRQEHCRQHERDRDQRDLQLLHRLDRRLARRHAGIFFHQALDILDHDDRVIDEQADRERQPEQGERVDAEPEQIKNAEGAEQYDGHRDRGDQHRAPALQEDEHHEDDEQDSLEQRFLHLADRQFDEGGRIVGVRVGEAVGEVGGEFRHPGLDPVGGLERVRPRRQRDRHAGARMSVDTHDRAVILGADLHPRDILDPHRRSIGQRLEDDILELFDRLHSRLGGHRRIEHLALGRRQAADVARGDFAVLCRDRRDYVAWHQRHGGKTPWIEPDAHRVRRPEHIDIADAVDARQGVLDVRRQEIGDIGEGPGIGGVIDADEQ